jgi:hypothetical protein
MKKLVVVSMSAMAVFIGWCGWLAYHYEGGNNENKGLYAPNTRYKVQQPPPIPISPEAIRQEQAIASAAKSANTDLRVNGREVVMSRGNMNDPERHDMEHYLYRVNRSLTRQ